MGILDVTNEDSPKLTDTPRSSTKRGGKFLLTTLGTLLLLAFAVGGSIYVVKTRPEILGLTKSVESEEEAEKLTADVGRIINLPQGETPTIATVNDLSQTQDRDFFKNAEVGDKVLVYQVAKRAYLYRPSQKKIIEVGVVNTADGAKPQVAGEETEIPVVTPTMLPSQVSATITPTVQSRGVTLTPTRTSSLTPTTAE